MSSEMARRIVARVLAAADIKVHEVEFASGQEPTDFALEVGEDFASLVRVEFTISGRTLARLLNKQERVLEKALTKLSPKALINAASNSRDVLRAVTPAIKRMVQTYCEDEGGNVQRITVDPADESDLSYTAKVDPRTQSVRVEMEYDVLVDLR